MLIGHSLADSNGVILAMDEVVTDALHRAPRSVIGQSYLVITHPADRARCLEQLGALRPGATPVALRKRYLRADGESVWARVQVSRLGSEGQLIGSFEFEEHDVPGNPYELWRTIKDLIQSERRRCDFLGPALADNAGWVILLHLYLAEAEGRGIDGVGLAAMTGHGTEQVERWLRVLEGNGLVEMAVRANGWQMTQAGIERLERVIKDMGA